MIRAPTLIPYHAENFMAFSGMKYAQILWLEDKNLLNQ
jgi:hypothetical protein